MAIRPSQNLSAGLEQETCWSVLDCKFREQMAHTLGTLSDQVEQALAALRAFIIQRELCGLRNWDAVVKDYSIPPEVLNRVGQVRRKPAIVKRQR
ncbi:DUF6665 family protein [Microvirga sp. 2TAF3]|uniref:DUF6665 family protein n=1 Tax=Microvirga sp. 2TAF3 TaxID=3233014 RepID=UPI003F9B5157